MNAGVYEHERARVYALVDRWIDRLNDEPIHATDQRFDAVAAGAICRGSDSDGGDIEAASFYAEPQAVWQQVGLFSQLLRAAAEDHEDPADD